MKELMTRVVLVCSVFFAGVVIGQAEAQVLDASLDNGAIKVGVNGKEYGGAIVWLSTSGGSNLVNNFDKGRQIQQSYYAGKSITDTNQSDAWSPWAWNPIMVGDSAGHSSPVLALSNCAGQIYVKTQPFLWDRNNQLSQSYMEQWITLHPTLTNVVVVDNRFTCFRSPNDEWGGPALCSQELPAVYFVSALDTIKAYTGKLPWQNGALVTIPNSPSRGNFPWIRYTPTEPWTACVNSSNFGAGVYTPIATAFLAGKAGKDLSWNTFDDETMYIAPLGNYSFVTNSIFSFRYYLLVGDLSTIRSSVYALHSASNAPPSPPSISKGSTSHQAAESVSQGGVREYPVNPVPMNQVHLNDVFWKPRIDINSSVTVPSCFKKCEETRIPNFRRAAKLQDGAYQGDPFDDSDVYKVAEGAAYSLAAHPDPVLGKYLDDLVALFAKAQQPDGYLYTSRIIHGDKAPGRAGPVRWLNELGGVTGDDSHELYNAGHMIEAAVAHYQATTNRAFLDVAIRLADLIQKNWGPGPEQLKISPGHQEIELALVKLGRATGDQKYIDLAKFLLDCRGHYRRPANVKVAFPDEYYSNEVPLTNLTRSVGHAVRTGYMLSGMTDIAALFGDPAYTRAVDAVWDDTVGSKLYLHGGLGSGVGMAEGFGNAYEMPNNGYNETCAAIANCLWNHRMFLLHADAKYIDVLERTLYNGFLSGVSLSGDHFFYPNPLVSKGGYARKAWFGCACCPVNVSRFLPSVPGLQYAVHGDQLYVNLFAGGTAEATVAATRVKLTQETRYPWEGTVKLAVDPEKAARFTVLVRIPGWARNQPVPTDLYRYDDKVQSEVSLTVNGRPQTIQLQKGYAAVTRRWKQGDVLTLNLAMPVRRVVANDKVADDAGRVALERGPLVYCFEGIDHGNKVFQLAVPDDAALDAKFLPDLLGGVTVITGRGKSAQRGADGAVAGEAAALTAIPYYAWCNRGAGQMQVWMPRKVDNAAPLPFPTASAGVLE